MDGGKVEVSPPISPLRGKPICLPALILLAYRRKREGVPYSTYCPILLCA